MKRTLSSLLLTVAALAIGGASTQLMAQGATAPQPVRQQPSQGAATQPQQAPMQYPVVVVDYAYLMEIHPELHTQMTRLDDHAKQQESAIQQEIVKLQAKEKELGSYQPGTLDYSQKTEQLRRDQSELSIKVEKVKEDLQLQRILCTYNAYIDIKAMVEALAKNNNMFVVVNHLDVAKRLPEQQSVQSKRLQLLNDPIVLWFNPSHDITATVEGMLLEKYVKTGKYPQVDYAKIREQMFNTMPGGAAAPQGTSVAAPGGQQPIPR